VNTTCLEWLAQVSRCHVLAETLHRSTKDSRVEVNQLLLQVSTQSRKLLLLTSIEHMLTLDAEHMCNHESAGTHLLFQDTLPHPQLKLTLHLLFRPSKHHQQHLVTLTDALVLSHTMKMLTLASQLLTSRQWSVLPFQQP
jgi:hypothetical protein